MKTLLAIVNAVIVTAATAGCAAVPFHTLPMAQGAVPVSGPEVSATGTEASVNDNHASAEDLPPAELTGELLYKYLVAEVADQRGHWQAAYISMLSVAQQTRDPRIARRAAEMAMNARQIDAALDAVRLWHQTSPQSEEAAHFFVTLLIANGQLQEAAPLLQQRLQAAAPSARPTLILHTYRLLAGSQNKQAAFQVLEQLLAPYASLPETHLSLAQAAHAAGDTARASQEAHTALQANPRSELAVLILAQVTPDKQEAANILASFLERHPSAREVRLAYARMLVEQNQFSRAQDQFKHLLVDQPGDLTALYAIGLLSMQSRNFQEAERYLTRFLQALASSPAEVRDPTQALLMLAQIAEERNDIPAALTWLEQVEAPTPEADFELQLKRAQLQAKQGNVSAALKVLNNLKVQDEGPQVQLWLAQAQIHRNANQPRQAYTVLEKALKRYPENTSLLYDYAMVAESLKRHAVMEKALRKIIRIAPENQHAYNALGYSLADRNVRLKEAHDLIKRALELAPEDPFIMDSMGWIEFRMGRLAEAEQLLRRAYQIRPDAEIAAHLGEVLWAKGRRDDAREVWREATQKDPKNDTLKDTLARLQVDL